MRRTGPLLARTKARSERSETEIISFFVPGRRGAKTA